ncbi:MAG: hypothetical protein JF615_07010, partial [Asticcacaulis sp.]|nr:hypothetical protein [Asticcacaulis sp.]
AQAVPDIDGLIDLLGNRPGRIYRWAAVASDVPERSVKKIAPQGEASAEG